VKRPVAKALAMTSAIMLIIESSLFQSESSRRAGGESAEAGAASSMAPETTAPRIVLAPFTRPRYRFIDGRSRQTEANPTDLAGALAYALRYQGRKRVHNANEIIAEIVARRLVEHLERSGFVVLRRPPEIGATAIGRGLKAKLNGRQRQNGTTRPVDSTRSCRSNSYPMDGCNAQGHEVAPARLRGGREPGGRVAGA
jgi:hypothetical protein